jgi:hypothetical protein
MLSGANVIPTFGGSTYRGCETSIPFHASKVGVCAITAYEPNRGWVEKNHGTGATTLASTRPLAISSRSLVSTNIPWPGLTELG